MEIMLKWYRMMGQKHSLTMFLLPGGDHGGEPAEAGELSMEPVWMNRAVRGWTTLTAGKVLNLLAAALALQGLGDVIPFQAAAAPSSSPVSS